MKLTVTMANTWRTCMAITHENSYLPYSYRTVQIELTPEQVAALAPRKLGVNCGKDVFEERCGVWLEESEEKPVTLDKENKLWCERCGGMFTNHNTEAHDLLAGKSPNS